MLPPRPTRSPRPPHLVPKALTEGHVWVGVARPGNTSRWGSSILRVSPHGSVGLGYVRYTFHRPWRPHRGQLGGCPLRAAPCPPPRPAQFTLEPLPSAAESCEVLLLPQGSPAGHNPLTPGSTISS